jgi:cobalt-zinc-cadmium resistance protein CzcA
MLKFQESIDFYEQEILPNAKSIVQTADTRFLAGEIDYLEWTMLVQQSIQVQEQFLEEKYNFNLAVLRFQQYSNQ